MKTVLEYIQLNSSLLFKCRGKKGQNAVFNSKGFWLSDEAQTVYDQIKNQPHLYVAWTLQDKGYYYVGKSFQKGGRWKRQHAYHLGTLAYHLLDNIRNDDQNHLHWIEAWMKENTMIRIDDHDYSISLKESVYICFVPFKIYSGVDHRTLSIQRIKDINKEYEEKLIKYYNRKAINLLNVQNNRKRIKQKASNSLIKKPSQQNKSTINQISMLKGCVSFKVNQNQLIHEVALTKPNLPVGPCYLTIKDDADHTDYLYIKANSEPVRIIRKNGRSVSQYFQAPDVGFSNPATSKSMIVQLEMKRRKIKTVIVTVCPSYAVKKLEDINPTQKKSLINIMGKNNMRILSDFSDACKIVFICASSKRLNSDLKIGEQKIKFRAISNPAENEYRPDDVIHQSYLEELHDKYKFQLKKGSTWRELIHANYTKDNPLQLCKAYELYIGSIYNNLHNRFADRFYILSAGWGLVKADFPLPNYDITFSGNANIPVNTTRSGLIGFNDFNHMISDEEDIIFIGTPGYLELFYDLTKNLKARKIVFWKGQNAIDIPRPNATFELRQYQTKNNISWWKELANKLLN